MDQLPVPVGWSVDVAKGDKSLLDTVVRVMLYSGWSGLIKVIGWLGTALAVSLGAPFWFDTLQKFLNIRSAGPTPPRAGT